MSWLARCSAPSATSSVIGPSRCVRGAVAAGDRPRRSLLTHLIPHFFPCRRFASTTFASSASRTTSTSRRKSAALRAGQRWVDGFIVGVSGLEPEQEKWCFNKGSCLHGDLLIAHLLTASVNTPHLFCVQFSAKFCANPRINTALAVAIRAFKIGAPVNSNKPFERCGIGVAIDLRALRAVLGRVCVVRDMFLA